MTRIEQEAFNIHQVQPMGHDGMLLVSCRCEYREDGADENGRRYHIDGGFLRGVTAGAGIQDVAVTPDVLIWTSYFDEGVFGGLGRRDPLWPVAYTYEPKDGLGGISDCYAMNADGNDVWIYITLISRWY